MSATLTPTFKSVQGELLGKDPTTWLMDQDEVDAYVDRQSDEVLECRERGRHFWPSMRNVGLVFTEVDEDGLFVRRLQCECCKLAVRTEKWEGLQRNKRLRFVPVAASVSYRTGANGENYLGPSGMGHMTSKQIRQSLASKVIGDDTLATIKRETKRRQKSGADLAAVG